MQLLLISKYPCWQPSHIPGLVQLVQNEILGHEAEIKRQPFQFQYFAISNGVQFSMIEFTYFVRHNFRFYLTKDIRDLYDMLFNFVNIGIYENWF